MKKLPPRLENLLRTEIDPAFAQRARLIFETVNQNKPKRVLDAGCGRGFYPQGLTYFDFIQEIHGIDINSNYLKIAKKNCLDRRIKIQRKSIYSLPFPDNYFDCIICSEILEHLKNDEEGLKELKRVMNKKAILIITVPNQNFPFLWDPLNWVLMQLFNTHIDKNIWWLAGIWADHERLYIEQDLKEKLIKLKFKIIKTSQLINFCWPFSHFLFYGIGKNIVERLKFNSFNRFDYNNKPKTISFLAKIFAFPTMIKLKSRSFVNLLFVLQK